MISSGLADEVIVEIPSSEIDWIKKVLYDTIDSIYKYQNSAMGILDTISQDYSNLEFDASKIQKELADPQNLELLKGIMTRLG